MRLINKGKEMRDVYAAAQPFPCVVINEAVAPGILRRAVSAVAEIPVGDWLRDDHAHQVHKQWIQDVGAYSPAVWTLFMSLNSQRFIDFLQDLTGIEDLVPDLGLAGGGIHKVAQGGRLEVHSDFNWYPALGMYRRVNALLYVNEDWQDSWGGDLELWSTDMKKCVRTIEPYFNRLVIFNTDERSFHGHPHALACPADRHRMAFAFYYYTKAAPSGLCATSTKALWQQRHGESNNGTISKD